MMRKIAASLLTPTLLLAAFVPRASAKTTWDTAPVEAALTRLLPDRLAKKVELIPLESTGQDQFRINRHGSKVRISATGPNAMMSGVNTYLDRVAGVDVSWNGDSLDHLPAKKLPLPQGEILQSANVKNRFALNDTDDGYTGAYRTWEDWEREIDVLALHGVNQAFVPVGAEAVYLDTFMKFGYSEAELLSWIPQPSHQPWWLLQNMCCYPAAVTRDLVDKRAALGRRIADRMRELGITPVLPGYFGTVPPGFATKVSGAHVVPQGGWVGFKRPDWLAPTSAPFAEVAQTFYASSATRFGATSHYKMDLLHEGGVAGDVNVPVASKAVQDALEAARPGATWVLLGWQNNPRPDTLAGIDRSRILIVDGLSDRYAGTDRNKDWPDSTYAFGSIWNFGGHTTMGANIGVWEERFWRWRAAPGSTLDGIAVMPEGGDNNPAAFDFLTGLAWREGPVDVAQWFADWSARRYGGPDADAARAWTTIGKTAYAMPADGSSEAQDGLFAAVPSLDATKAARWSPSSMRYDASAFAASLPALMKVDPKLRGSSAYRYDLADVARQVLSNRSRSLLPRLKAAYTAKDRPAFAALAAQWMEHLELLEQLAATNEQTMLGSLLADVRTWSDDQGQVQRMEQAARTLLTVWGDRPGFNAGLGDYANREWAGLVGGYYAPRWKKYLEELSAALAENRAPKSFDWYQNGADWAATPTSLPSTPRGDVHKVASRVLDLLRADPEPLQARATLIPSALPDGATAVLQATVRNPDPLTAGDETVVSFETQQGSGVSVEPAQRRVGVLAPGAEAPVSVQVSATGAADTIVSTLTLVITSTRSGKAERVTVPVRVMRSGPVSAPDKTVTTNTAQFGRAGDKYAIEGGGSDLWGGTNHFGAIYRDDVLAPATMVSTRVTAQDNTGPWARAGLIARTDLGTASGAGYVNIALTPGQGCVFSWDNDNNGSFDRYTALSAIKAPAFVRLARTGDTVTGSCSSDGKTWTEAGSAPAPADVALDAGLFMTATNGGSQARGIVEFAGFQVGVVEGPQAPAPGEHHLSDLPWVSSTGGVGPWERDRHNGESAAGDGGAISLGGVAYAKGLGSNADARLELHLGGACTRFVSAVGIDDSMNKPGAEGDVVVRVEGDGKPLLTSDVLKGGGQPLAVDLDVTGVRRLVLVVSKYDVNNWWDRTSWGGARVICG
ncbi:alpha-N-acetylglucosaminidase TIM-barrel domain-containing protein [Nonomuraea sp. NPDC049152]|uniref:alpha-N-acetylglucosaminidase TIM-barrel domain-containing protein n=1 Tax=Nonomuraea sp. NPDC049152 TaxID=3154350 RepID=UPI0033D1BE56